MYANNVIEMNGSIAAPRRGSAHRARRRLLREVYRAVETAVTLGIGVCCAVCLVLVFTML